MQVMPGDLTLGLDIGTTAVKVLVLDDGGWWKLATFPTPPLEELIDEMNTHLSEWMDEEDLARVVTIGACGQGQSAIIFDDENQILGDIITWQDTPNADIIDDFDARFPLQWRIDNLGAHLPEGRAWLPVKLKQWALRHPELVAQANVALQVKDLVNYSLTGVVCSDSRSMRGLSSDEELLRWIGLGDIIPPLMQPTDIIGQSMGSDIICGTCDMSAGLEGLFLGLGIAGNLANTSEHIAIHPSICDEVPTGMTWLPACGMVPSVLYSSTSSGGGALIHGLSEIDSAPSVADLNGCADWLLRNHGEKGGPVFDAHVRGNRGPGADPRHTGGWSDSLDGHSDSQLATSLIDGVNAALDPIIEKLPEWNRLHIGGGLADATIIIRTRDERWSEVHRRQGKEVSALGIARLAQAGAAPLAIIFGAGKVGRGFLADILYNSGWQLKFVDTNPTVVEELTRMGNHVIHRLCEPAREQRIRNCGAAVMGDPVVEEWIQKADLLMTAIGASHLESWSKTVADAVERRLEKGPLDIVLAENHHSPAQLVRTAMAIEDSRLGIIQSQILRSCIEPTAELIDKFGELALRVQNHSELPMDKDAIQNLDLLMSIEGVTPKSDFELELTRKVYTYNAINAVISYIGHLKGYQLLSEAAQDPDICTLAEQAGMEASAALVAAHGFNSEEQEQWVNRAVSKYQDERIVDPIARQCRDPMRKLGANDRLLGPILLCVKHGIPCEALKVGLAAALQYDPDEEESERDASIAELRKLRSSFSADASATHTDENLLNTQEILAEMGFNVDISGAESTLKRLIRPS